MEPSHNSSVGTTWPSPQPANQELMFKYKVLMPATVLLVQQIIAVVAVVMAQAGTHNSHRWVQHAPPSHLLAP
jgi:hypothetical protein